MQKETTGMHPRAKDYVTIVQQACDKVTGFEQLYKEMERAICITGKSKSTLTNYSRHLGHLALHYNCFSIGTGFRTGHGLSVPGKKSGHHFGYIFQIHRLRTSLCVPDERIGIQTVFTS